MYFIRGLTRLPYVLLKIIKEIMKWMTTKTMMMNDNDNFDRLDSHNTINPKKSMVPEVLQWGISIIIALIIALLIRGFIFEIVLVSGSSMDDTLADGQRLYVNKVGYYISEPKRNDVIIMIKEEGNLDKTPLFQKVSILKKIIPDFKETDYVKRIIGVPGDIIDIKNGKVYRNGEELVEPFSKGKTYAKNILFPVTIPENKYLVLGDNRENSSDGREFGLIDRSRIKGKAVYVVLPLNNMKAINK